MSEKLLAGIREFNQKHSEDYKSLYKLLKEGQNPDAIFIGCSDSRVLPNILSQAAPGELFVVRNVGNIIPLSDKFGIAQGDESEASALEYGLEHLSINDIVVCGHSGCGAMKALLHGRHNIVEPNLKNWLRHADEAPNFIQKITFESEINEIDKLSQANVLLQLENIKTYPIVKDLMTKKEITFHAWWFDLEKVKVLGFNFSQSKFEIIN
jgi:carbonic anhydrase